MTRITFFGLGAMGERMARRLLAAKHELTVWNRSSEAAARLEAAGARRAPTPRAAVEGAEVVWSMVYDDAASRSVWLDTQHGAAAALSPTAIAVESSTLSPAWVEALAAAISARGAVFVDAPVAGSRPQADAGQLIFMAGGPASTIDKLRPLFSVLGAAVHGVGPVGSGMRLKLAVNALFATQVAVLAEHLNLLRRSGVDPESAFAALRAMPVLSPPATGAGALILAGDFAPQAPVSLIAKDLSYALAAGQAVGATLAVTASVKARYDAAQAAGWGDENLVAIAKLDD